MPPTVLLLDIDGTLVDNTQQHIAAWDEAFQQLGKPLDRETLRRNIGTVFAGRWGARAGGGCGRPGDHVFKPKRDLT